MNFFDDPGDSIGYRCENGLMTKTLKDWIAMLSLIMNLASLFIGHVIPPAWQQAITAWRFFFGLSVIVLVIWAFDRYVLGPIREATAALSKLEETAKSLTCAVGTQSNRVDALDGKLASFYESISTRLDLLLKRIPPLPPKT